jgi:hypothetical protein
VSEPNTFPPPTGDEALPEDPGEALQFDQAEFATPPRAGPVCTACKQPIVDEYYEVTGKVFCTGCRHLIEAAFRGGSRFGRAIKALVLGSVAAVIGAVIYYAIIRATGWNIGIIAVLIGLMVGGAVRKGSGNRGGLGYQFLAVFLTYSAIAAMLIPVALEGLAAHANKGQPEQAQKQAEALGEKVEHDRAKTKAKAAVPPEGAAAKSKNAETAPGPAPPAAAPTPVATNDAKGEKVARDVVAKDVVAKELPGANGPPLTLSSFLMALVIVIGLSYTFPVLAAFGSPISGLIFAFALWEAWKINRRLVLTFNGPFRLGTADEGQLAHEVVDNEP